MFGKHGHARHDGPGCALRRSTVGCGEELEDPVQIIERSFGIDG
jgi:hypothetical protein